MDDGLALPHGLARLRVWHEAIDLADRVYALTEAWPERETFVLSAQARRAAASVVANISEGQGRATRGDRVRFFCIARGSVYELCGLLQVARRREFSPRPQIEAAQRAATTVAVPLHGLIRGAASNPADPAQTPVCAPARPLPFPPFEERAENKT
ncbi:MAG: four helix bundle protein [Methanobacteriota archaeon]